MYQNAERSSRQNLLHQSNQTNKQLPNANPSQINQPLLPGESLDEHIMKDPHYKLEEDVKCYRIVIMAISIFTLVLFGSAVIIHYFYSYYGQNIASYVLFLLTPHLLLALAAHLTLRKPIGQQIMSAKSSTCSSITLVFFTLVPLLSICVTICFGIVLHDCHSDSCGVYLVFLFVFGIIPALVFAPLWFLPFAYYKYTSKLNEACSKYAIGQSIVAPQNNRGQLKND